MGDNSKGVTRRENVSMFMVHLTRDTEDGKSAKENLIDILYSRVILKGSFLRKRLNLFLLT